MKLLQSVPSLIFAFFFDLVVVYLPLPQEKSPVKNYWANLCEDAAKIKTKLCVARSEQILKNIMKY